MTCSRAAAVVFLKEEGTQTLGTYVDRHQTTVAEWVALRPIYEVCDRYIGYEGGGSHSEPWWQKTVDRKQLRATLEEILATARARRWEYCSHGKSKGGEEVADSVSEGSWNAYMRIILSTLPQNNGNLPLPFFCGKYPIVLLGNIY